MRTLLVVATFRCSVQLIIALRTSPHLTTADNSWQQLTTAHHSWQELTAARVRKSELTFSALNKIHHFSHPLKHICSPLSASPTFLIYVHSDPIYVEHCSHYYIIMLMRSACILYIAPNQIFSSSHRLTHSASHHFPHLHQNIPVRDKTKQSSKQGTIAQELKSTSYSRT